MKEKYTEAAIGRAKIDALEWLEKNEDAYPRSWDQTAANDECRGYVMFDDYDFEAPPIAGYEALAAASIVTRHETQVHQGQERVHFKRVSIELVKEALDGELAD